MGETDRPDAVGAGPYSRAPFLVLGAPQPPCPSVWPRCKGSTINTCQGWELPVPIRPPARKLAAIATTSVEVTRPRSFPES